MSYADLLSQYANKMSEVRGHAEEVSQSIASTKAAGAKELYDRAREHLATAGEASAAASGAYMAGRKLYKKFQASRAAKAKAGEDDPEAGTEAEGAEGAQGASDGGRAVGQGTSEGAGSGAEGGAGAEAEDTIDTTQKATQLIQPKPIDDIEPIEGAKGPVRVSQAPEAEPQGDLGRNIKSAEEYGDTGTKAGSGTEEASGAGEEASAEGPTLEGAPTEAVEATAGDTVSAANVGQQVGGNVAKAAVKTAVKSSGEALGEETGAAVGEGLASQALDFLGPVGLGIGAITGLVDLFEGIFGKKPKSASQEATPLETEGGGLDVKGLTATDSPATATLV